LDTDAASGFSTQYVVVGLPPNAWFAVERIRGIALPAYATLCVDYRKFWVEDFLLPLEPNRHSKEVTVLTLETAGC
jgi:hypothetical protein